MDKMRKWGVNPNLNPDWPAVDEDHECHIAEQYINMWDGWFKVFLSIPAMVVLAIVFYAITIDALNYYL